MKRIHSLAAVCGLSLTLSAAMALPPVLDRVPDDALFTLVVPAPQTMQKNMAALATAVEAPGELPSLENLLAMGDLGAGIDLTRSLAIVIMAPKDFDKPKAPKKADKPAADKGEKPDAKSDVSSDSKPDAMNGDKSQPGDGAKPAKKPRRHVEVDDEEMDFDSGMERMVMIVPITKYEDFLNNFGVKPAGEGKVDAIVYQNEDAYVKSLGDGYAAMGPNKALVEAFTGKVGASPLKNRLGKAGEAVADNSDIIAIVNIDRIRAKATEAMKQMDKDLRAQMDMMGQKGLDKNLDMTKRLADTVLRDTQTLVAGVKTGSLGLSLDVVGAFKPDSYLAKVFADGGNASPILSKLFGGKYLAAVAIDLSGAGAKQFMKDIVSKADLPGGEAAAKVASDSLDNTLGQGVVMGFPEGGAFSGVLTSTVLFTSAKDPQAALKNFKASLSAMDGAKVGDLVYSTKYTEPSGKPDESPFAAWETKMTSESGELPAQMQQAMPLLFGPAGVPSGYVAVANGGLYTSYAKSTELMNKAINAAKEGNLGSDTMVKQTQGMLPKNRLAEAYLGTRTIMDLGLPFAAMAMGGGIPMDKIPEKLPPVGAALSAENGSMRLSLVIPAPVIKTGITLGEAFDEAKSGGGAGAKPKGDDDANKPDKGEKGAGQPKF